MSGSPADVPDTSGNRLHLPDSGPGSPAGYGRRLLALLVDWVVAVLCCYAVGLDPLYGPPTDSMVASGVLVLERTLLVATLGFSIGHRLLGLVVTRLDGTVPPGLRSALLRSVLVALIIPALVLDRDGRGLHDLAAGTVVVRR